MGSLITRTLQKSLKRPFRFLYWSANSFNHKMCAMDSESLGFYTGRCILDFPPKSSRSSTWYVAAAGFCAFSSSLLSGSYSTSQSEEDSEENAHDQQNVKRKARVVFVLGGPGSGKGTQCEKIVENFGFTHLSAGDLLRAEINSGSQYGVMIQNTIKEGKIVPSEVTVHLLQKAMNGSDNDKFLIDGFPRNEENRAAFEAVTGIEPEFVIFFDCPQEELEKRLINRNQGRVDDNIDTIRKRFKVFEESTLPVVQYYERKQKLQKINGAREKEEVFKSLKPLFLPFLEEELLQLTKELLNGIDEGDYALYKRLCDPSLTAFEPDAQGHLVEGLPFHKFYLDMSKRFPSPSKPQSQVSSPKITFIGDEVALVTYTRLVQSTKDGVPCVEAFNETRIWQRGLDDSGIAVWKLIHFHKSKCPLHRAHHKSKGSPHSCKE